MSSITNLSSSQLRQAADLKEKISALENELSQLLGSTSQPVAVKPAIATAPKKKGGMSAAGRARIVAAQKARWAKIKAAKPETKAAAAAKPVIAIKAPPAKKKFTMSAAAKAKISAAAKARWAKVRGAKK